MFTKSIAFLLFRLDYKFFNFRLNQLYIVNFIFLKLKKIHYYRAIYNCNIANNVVPDNLIVN